MRFEVLRALNEARNSGRPVVRAINLSTGDDMLVYPDQDTTLMGSAAADAARQDRSGVSEVGGQHWFLAVYNPPLELVIVGAVHIAQPLTKMALLMGYEVRVIEPRRAFAAPERFPGVRLSNLWPDEALAEEPLCGRSALAVLSHDPKIDDPALAIALRSPCFYVGALGSKRTHAARLARLRDAGFGADSLKRIHGPIGLTIGARSPEEIAVSILAEITQQLRSPSNLAPSDSGPGA